tara:strand:+ start:136 stop:351 length:216 start_codon:yes stop_codon:yes gene_type:complete
MNNNNNDDCDCKYKKMYWSLQNKIKNDLRPYREQISILQNENLLLQKKMNEKPVKKIDLTSQKYKQQLHSI